MIYYFITLPFQTFIWESFLVILSDILIYCKRDMDIILWLKEMISMLSSTILLEFPCLFNLLLLLIKITCRFKINFLGSVLFFHKMSYASLIKIIKFNHYQIAVISMNLACPFLYTLGGKKTENLLFWDSWGQPILLFNFCLLLAIIIEFQ